MLLGLEYFNNNITEHWSNTTSPGLLLWLFDDRDLFKYILNVYFWTTEWSTSAYWLNA